MFRLILKGSAIQQLDPALILKQEEERLGRELESQRMIEELKRKGIISGIAPSNKKPNSGVSDSAQSGKSIRNPGRVQPAPTDVK
jgi:hypothetical protein